MFKLIATTPLEAPAAKGHIDPLLAPIARHLASQVAEVPLQFSAANVYAYFTRDSGRSLPERPKTFQFKDAQDLMAALCEYKLAEKTRDDLIQVRLNSEQMDEALGVLTGLATAQDDVTNASTEVTLQKWKSQTPRRDNLRLDQITVDTSIQCRVGGCDPEIVSEYADAMQNGKTLPPIVVFRNGKVHRIADGHHRHEASRRLGATHIEVEIYEGDSDQAKLYAAGSNATHGKPRTNADKRLAVTLLLGMTDICGQSDSVIADLADVDQKTVGTVRSELEREGKIPALTERRGRDGRKITIRRKSAEAMTLSASKKTPQKESTASVTGPLIEQKLATTPSAEASLAAPDMEDVTPMVSHVASVGPSGSLGEQLDQAWRQFVEMLEAIDPRKGLPQWLDGERLHGVMQKLNELLADLARIQKTAT